MPTTEPAAIPAEGTWAVDPAASTLAFAARGNFGLAWVKGEFRSFEGQMTAHGDSIRGELRIAAQSLDTGNAKRDTHLRSADFFDVTSYPTVSFRLLAVTAEADGTRGLAGELQIRDNVLGVTAPLELELEGDRLTMRTELAVDRAAAGVGWSKMGMIKGRAKLTASVTLLPAG